MPVVSGSELENEFVIHCRTVGGNAHGSGMLGGGIVYVAVRPVKISYGLRVDLGIRAEIESFEFKIVHDVRRRAAYPVRFKMDGRRRIRSSVCWEIRNERIMDSASEAYWPVRYVEFRSGCGYADSKVSRGDGKRGCPRIQFDCRIDDLVPSSRTQRRPRRRPIGSRQARSKGRVA